MNTLQFVKGQGGLGRPLSGLDHVSGLIFYSDATLPSGFTSSDRIKTVFSTEQAEALGITNLSSGETKAVAKLAITGTPAAGDTVKIVYAGITGSVTVLSTYTFSAGDVATTTTAAAALAAAINALTSSHGFTATNSTSNLLITTKAGEGIFPNSGTPYSSTTTGGGTYTWTQPTGASSTVLGIASDIDILHYHVSEFFRQQPKGKLYISIQATADVATFSKYTDLVNYAQGEIRQIGIYEKSTAFATAHVTTLQALYTSSSANKKPCQILYGAEVSATADITTLTNLRSLSGDNVSVTIGQDGAAKGYKLWKATGKSIGIIGATLGAVALAAVNEDIAWYSKFNMSNGVELNTLAFANGQNYIAISDAAISNLDLYGWIFLLKEIDLTGSFFNDSHTCTSPTSDYAYIELGRTIDKAIRGCRAFVTPALGSPVTIDPVTGKLAEDSIAYFETLCKRALDQMQAAGEISGYQVLIDPDQNVISTGKLTIGIEIVPKGTARTILINIGYVTQLSAA